MLLGAAASIPIKRTKGVQTMSSADRAAPARGSSRGRRLWRLVGIGASLALLCASATVGVSSSEAAGKGKKAPKKGPKSNVGEVASKVLLDKGDQVGDCADKYALHKGASRVSIDTKVTIDSKGTVVNVVTTVVVDKVAAAPIKECVDALIKALKFPAIPAPLTTIERNWTVASN